MTNMRFPFLNLPNDLGVEVIKTMSLHEQTAFSFASKKTYSKMKALRIPISHGTISMREFVEISLKTKDFTEINFKLKSRRRDGMITSLDDILANLDVSKEQLNFAQDNRLFTLSSQGMSLGEWVQHLCSIFQFEHYGADFSIDRMSQLEVQSLRSIFPKLLKINLICSRDELNEQDNLYAQTVLRAFLSDVQIVRLISVPLHGNLSIAHIATANLKQLCLTGLNNSKIDDILTLNSEWINITSGQIMLRDMNRFFKLWMKGSHPRLKGCFIFMERDNNTDWTILLKGLRAENAEDSEVEELEVKNVTIKNSAGVSARIRICDEGLFVSVQFSVSNHKSEPWINF